MATLVGLVLGLLIGAVAVCPEQILLLAGFALFVAFIGLLGDAPDSLRQAWSDGKRGKIYAGVGRLSRCAAPVAAWFALGIAPVAILRLIGGGAC